MSDANTPAPSSAAITSGVTSEQSLVDWLQTMPEVDPSSPSRLPGWSVGHVMTHIARNADGVLSMFSGLHQYPHGLDGRNADIEAGASRGWSELVDDVVSRSRAVAAAIAGRADWTGTVHMLPGERPTAQVPLLRQREVEVHRVDLGFGDEFADMPADYVRRDLRLMEMLWTSRKPMGMTTLPDAALALDPPTRLAWLMGRVEVPGLDPAGLF
ncbi:MAG: maleylpyruvate isomerase family mycothiol-dependent enzyme [Ilumatobacteraceae bacterium]|nr:maleylpyruvate isomerase family mycothiol-dependent enzyme [Ilumatobacteraceae bacterium]